MGGPKGRCSTLVTSSVSRLFLSTQEQRHFLIPGAKTMLSGHVHSIAYACKLVRFKTLALEQEQRNVSSPATTVLSQHVHSNSAHPWLVPVVLVVMAAIGILLLNHELRKVAARKKAHRRRFRRRRRPGERSGARHSISPVVQPSNEAFKQRPST